MIPSLWISRMLNPMDPGAATRADFSWEQLVALLTVHERTPCQCHVARPTADCRYKYWGFSWSPATFRSDPTYEPDPVGDRRRKDTVEFVTAAAFDVDHTTVDRMDAISDALLAAGTAHIIHSTHSHRADDACFRLVLPISRPITGSEWQRLRAVLCASLNIPADDKAKDSSRLFYRPSAPVGATPIGASAPGNPLDVDALLKPRPVVVPPAVPVPDSTPVPVGGEPVDVDRLRAVLKDRSDPDSRALITAALKGEVIAHAHGLGGKPARNATLQKLASIVAFSVLPTVPREVLVELFRPALNVLPQDPGETTDWVKVFTRQLIEATKQRIEKDKQKAADTAADIAALGLSVAKADTVAREADPAATPDEDLAAKYPPKRIEAWAAEQGCTCEEWAQRWIITAGAANWVWTEGRYKSSVGEKNLAVALRTDLVRAPVRLMSTNPDTGVEKARSLPDILAKHSRVARHLEASLVLQKSRFDAETETFWEAVCPVRPLKPEENPRIQEWLEMFADDQTDLLLDWIASVTQLDRQTCAVYIHAAPGIGKTLFATGIANIWCRGGPSALEDVLGNFNGTITDCPLIFADEKLPENHKKVTTALRQLLGQSVRPLNRKYMPTAKIHGSIRLVLAANNDKLLDTGEELTSEDLEAIAGRFLYIHAAERAPQLKAYLEKKIGPKTITNEWLLGDGIAKHALWLATQREVKGDGRFLVQGPPREFHQHLATSAGVTSNIAEAVMKALKLPPTSRERNNSYVQVGHGECWISTQWLQTNWRELAPAAPPASATKLGTALKSLSNGSLKVLTCEGQVTYHRLKPDLIASWAERSGTGSAEEIRDVLVQPNEIIRKAMESRGWPIPVQLTLVKG